MNPRSILLIVAALAVATATALFARNILGGQQQTPTQEVAAPAPEGPKILVARANLPTGKILDVEDVRWQEWPTDNIAENYMREGSVTPEELSGKVVRYGIISGEPVTDLKIVGPGERGFLAAVLAPGMRAVTVPINPVTGLAGFIFPGDRIDLILNHNVTDDAGMSRRVSETVIRNLRVLAVDTRTNDQTTQPQVGKTVTLEVTPKLAEKITLLQRLGSLSLSLRSISEDEATTKVADRSMPFDKSTTHTWDAEISPLLPPVDPASSKIKVRLDRGGEQSVVEFKKRKEQ